jgi:NitT/TauT family transport system substrate-binding protein
VRKDAGIKSEKDFNGKTVATPQLGNTQDVAANPKLVKNLLTALVEVTQQINTDKNAAAKILNAELKKETGKALQDAVIAKAMERVEFTWDPVSASLRKSAEAAHKVGFLKAPPDLKGIYSLGPLNEALKEKNLPAVAE